jgi:hypothetical protein
VTGAASFEGRQPASGFPERCDFAMGVLCEQC